jgi:hypothetical protein
VPVQQTVFIESDSGVRFRSSRSPGSAVLLLGMAYWDGNEGAESEGGGWTNAGHAVSVKANGCLDGWIEVLFEQ